LVVGRVIRYAIILSLWWITAITKDNLSIYLNLTGRLSIFYSPQMYNSDCTFTGTTKIKNLDQNIGALSLKFTESDLREISEAVPIEDVAGSRYFFENDKDSWKFADTPPIDPRVST